MNLETLYGDTRLLANLLDAGPACTLADADLFTQTDDTEAVRQAKALCAGCPAWAACLDYALATRPVEGVWAGHTATELDGLALVLGRFNLHPVSGEVA